MLSRRDVLKTGGALVVSFALGARAKAQTASGADAALGKPVDPAEVDSFLAVHADGSVTVPEALRPLLGVDVLR